MLKKAKEFGTYVLVGVHDDKVVNQIKGGNFPIMNLHERVLSVLSCKYVDEVIIGAPYCPSKDMLKSLNIHTVIHGSIQDGQAPKDLDPYKEAKELGIFQLVPSPSDITTTTIIDRIIKNRLAYEERNRKKEAKEISEMQNSN